MSNEEKLEYANKLIFVKKYDEAKRVLDQLVKLELGSIDMHVHLRRIELGLKLQGLEALQKSYQRAVESDPDGVNPALCLLLTEQHGDMITAEEAIARFQEILRKDGKNAVAHYGIAFSLEMQGNIERAIYNYEQSIMLDVFWYPSYFGLSQLYYQKGDGAKGDQYFFEFERLATYNVYGNFDTHRKLMMEFMDLGKYKEAETAVTTLSEWWVENKGYCPPEITIHELLAVARIAELNGDKLKTHSRKAAALSAADQLLDERNDVSEGVLYFVARILEEYGELEASIDFYKHVLRQAGENPGMVQKIGSQFLSLGEYELAKDLFLDAYDSHPDNPEIRFCILVTNLKLAGVNVEEYLVGKERLKQLTEMESDKVEILALLHSLQAKFKDDPDVLQQMGDVYLRLNNKERAGRHFERMFELDGKSKVSSLRYVSYLLHHDDAKKAMDILDQVSAANRTLSEEEKCEINWLRSVYFARQRDFERSLQCLQRVTAKDPWNVSYLVQEIVNRTMLAPGAEYMRELDAVVEQLSELNESDLDWQSFDQVTARFEAALVYDVAYVRRKIRFLYSEQNEEQLSSLVATACKHDPALSTSDFLRLLNTNFDSPRIYWALGVLHKELWQLEVANMWFNQCLRVPGVSDRLKGKCYVEIADCSVWLDKDLRKAMEYAKLGLDMADQADGHMLSVLTHAYLRNGQIKLAQTQLNQRMKDIGFEDTYLLGLVEYRNGAKVRANEIWKPLLTANAEDLRSHHIKQDILRYYFEGEPYLKVN